MPANSAGTIASIQAALSRAKSTLHWTVGMCDNFVANMYGFSNSGYNTALDHWNAIPSADKHPGDTKAPAGALVFWGGGDGHVAISDGTGYIYSTDISGAGTVSRVPLSEVSQKWGKPYLGWSSPYFSGQTTNVGGYNGSVGTGITGTAPTAQDLSTGLSQGIDSSIRVLTAGLFDSIGKFIWWGGCIVLGLVLMGLGIVVLGKRALNGNANVGRGVSAVQSTLGH